MPKKILLADDSLTIQKVVELTLSGTDYELTCVSNGQQALESLASARPDLILADVVMPEKNGYEVCEAVKSNPATARIPLILLSGTFEPFDRERAERIGCDLVVSKPFDSQQLLEEIEALLARAAAEPPPPPEEAPFETAFVDEAAPISTAGASDAESPFSPAPEPVLEEPPSAAGASDTESPFSPAPEPVLEELPSAAGAPVAESLFSPAPEPVMEESPAASGGPSPEPEGASEVLPLVQEARPSEPAPSAEPDAEAPTELAIEEISADEAEVLFDVPAPLGQAPPPEPALVAAVPQPAPSLAELTEEQIERIASRVVEKLSDRVVREIAWEVVPDMAETAVKRRIEELESSVE